MMNPIVSTYTEPTESVKESELKSSDSPSKIPEEASLPPSLRVESSQLPLVVDILGAKPYYDTFDVKQLSETIDGYINKEVLRQKMRDTPESYKSVLDSVVKRLDLSKDVTVWTKLEKVAEYMRINQKMLDAIDERERLLTDDPLTLSATQLKKRWELTHG